MEDFRRMIIKVSDVEGASATIPVSNDHTDGSWLITDIYEGELFLNLIDNILQTRTDAGIINLNASSSSDADRVVQDVRYDEGVEKGEPLRITGYNVGSGIITVEKADASASAEMPSYGLAMANYSSGATGQMIAVGTLTDVNTSAFSEGDTVYVAVGGGLTNVKPIEPNLIQNVGFVARSNANNGSIEVVAIGRANDVPNLPLGHTFIGTSTNPTTINLTNELNNKQDTLVSGTNIKTIAGTSILGSGDIPLDNDFTSLNDTPEAYTGSGGFAVQVNAGETGLEFVASGGGGGKFVDGTDSLDAVYTDGNVGIGTVTPSAPLEVSGRISQIGLGNSTFLGEFAGLSDDGTNNNNVAIGYEALKNNVSGPTNVAIGQDALKNNTTGQDNVAIGNGALVSNNGPTNVAVGRSCLLSNQTGGYNIALGLQAMSSGNKGWNNIALGQNSLQTSNNSASNNVGIGVKAGQTSNGTNNVFIGSNAGMQQQNGNSKVAIGENAGANASGNNSVGIGKYGGYNNSGNSSVGIGENAGFGNSGAYQIAIGQYAGLNNTGAYNINIGRQAGIYGPGYAINTNGTNSLFIGRDTQPATTSDTNQTVIGYQAIGNGSNTVTLGNDSVILTVLKGVIRMTGVPSSDAGLDVGDVWQDGGTLKIVT